MRYGLSRECLSRESRMDSYADTVCLACTAYSNEWIAMRINSGYGFADAVGFADTETERGRHSNRERQADTETWALRMLWALRIQTFDSDGWIAMRMIAMRINSGYGLSGVYADDSYADDSYADQQRIRSVWRVCG